MSAPMREQVNTEASGADSDARYREANANSWERTDGSGLCIPYAMGKATGSVVAEHPGRSGGGAQSSRCNSGLASLIPQQEVSNEIR